MKVVVGHAEVLYLALLSGVLTLLPIFVPLGGGLLTALAPFPFIVLASKYPWQYVVSVLGLESGVILLNGRLQPLVFLGQCALIAWGISWATRRRWSISQTLLCSIAVPCVVGMLVAVAYSLLMQLPLDALVMRYVQKIVDASQEYVRTLEQFQEGDAEQWAVLIEALPQLLLTVLPALIVIGHLFLNLLNYLLARRYCWRSQPPLALPPDDLACWKASEYLVWVFLASGASLFAPSDVVGTIGVNLLLITLALYFLQGVAIVLFWGRRLPVPLGVQCFLLALLFLVAGPFCVIICTAAGLFDLWVDFRRQRRHSMLP